LYDSEITLKTALYFAFLGKNGTVHQFLNMNNSKIIVEDVIVENWKSFDQTPPSINIEVFKVDEFEYSYTGQAVWTRCLFPLQESCIIRNATVYATNWGCT